MPFLTRKRVIEFTLSAILYSILTIIFIILALAAILEPLK